MFVCFFVFFVPNLSFFRSFFIDMEVVGMKRLKGADPTALFFCYFTDCFIFPLCLFINLFIYLCIVHLYNIPPFLIILMYIFCIYSRFFSSIWNRCIAPPLPSSYFIFTSLLTLLLFQFTHKTVRTPETHAIHAAIDIGHLSNSILSCITPPFHHMPPIPSV